MGTGIYHSVKARERHCNVWLRVNICIMIAFRKIICIIYQVYVWIYHSRLKWLIYFVNLEFVDMLDIWLNEENDNFDWFKFVWLGYLLVCIMHVKVILYIGTWLCFIDLEFSTHLGVKHHIEQRGNAHSFIF